MRRKQFHPNAYLERRRNVLRGLKARTKLLEAIGKARIGTITELSRLTVLSYAASRHHLRLLEAEDIITRVGKRPYRWRVTGKGQKSLDQLPYHEASAKD
jgi:DNA-binding IclR family transcriptional regulator